MMKRLTDLLRDAGVKTVKGSEDTPVQLVTFDSRQCGSNSLFVAVKGTRVDGHDFIGQAIDNGAIVVVCEQNPNDPPEHIICVQVKDSAKALGIIASNFFGRPSTRLNLVGVTGTNGKTTIVSLLFEMIRKFGYKAGKLSTIENKIEEQVIGATHTTPDPIQINRLLYDMVEKGCSYCFMEVSSHAIHQQRIAGLYFKGGIFSNLTQDHLDYHPTFEDYLKAKKKFFDDLEPTAFALTNLDDKNGMVMLQNTRAAIKTYALKKPADFKGKIIENQFEGLQLNIDGQEVWCKLVGQFNGYNILAVYAACIMLGASPETTLTAISTLETVEGRFDTLRSTNNITGIVDYAHSPDALKNVLETIQSIRSRNETLITVVGAGGDRDASKRPIMGRIAGLFSDKVILTSDNPRSENPEAIIQQIKEGMDPADAAKTLSITDRKEAIRTACMLAQPNDIILVAGKGHEKYQEIQGKKIPFDDKEFMREFLMLKTTTN